MPSRCFRGKRLLDVGGTSDYANYLYSVFPGADVYTLNRVPDALGQGAESILGDALRLPFRNGSLDIIVSFDTIEHLSNPDDMIDEAHRTLTRQGILAIATPNLADIASRISLLSGNMPFSYTPSRYKLAVPLSPLRGKQVDSEHRCVFTLKALREMLEIHDFSVVGTSGYCYADPYCMNSAPGYEQMLVGFHRIRRMANVMLPASMREGLVVLSMKGKVSEHRQRS